jgi:hypothetical protein
VIAALERAGLATEHVEGFADDYPETLAHWAGRLDERRDEAIALVGPERLRVWRPYLRVARNGFLGGFTGVYQTQSLRPPASATTTSVRPRHGQASARRAPGSPIASVSADAPHAPATNDERERCTRRSTSAGSATTRRHDHGWGSRIRSRALRKAFAGDNPI